MDEELKINYQGNFMKLQIAIILALASLQSNQSLASQTDQSIGLEADLNSSLSALDQIRKSFGKYSIESPELFEGNHQGFEHIKIQGDSDKGACFAFYIHRDLDKDMDKHWPMGKERQRNEIKGYKGSPEAMKAMDQETASYSWDFKIDPTFSVTHQFCHFFQLKPVGEKNSPLPILTLSGVVHSGKEELELRFFGKKSHRFKLADWNDCKGKWLRCECVTKYGENGEILFSLRSTDGTLSAEHRMTNLMTWHPDFSFVRPKWGIYRSLQEKEKIKNEEDRVYMNDFTVRKWKTIHAQN